MSHLNFGVSTIFLNSFRLFLSFIGLKYLTKRVPQDIEYLIATKQGLFMSSRCRFIRLCPGEWYGITMDKERIFAFNKLGPDKGQVVQLSRTNHRIRLDCILPLDLSGGCHQIDIYEGHLYITDTYNNAVIKFDLKETEVSRFYPLGKLEQGRKSPNYGHINSIYIRDSKVYLLCHNETTKTDRTSQILSVDLQFQCLQIEETSSKNAHNIIVTDTGKFHCNSHDSELIFEGKTVIRDSMFTRGLSISNTTIALGGSEYSPRAQRPSAKGKVTFSDLGFKKKGELSLPGMVQEIRLLNTPDYGLSQFANEQPETFQAFAQTGNK